MNRRNLLFTFIITGTLLVMMGGVYRLAAADPTVTLTKTATPESLEEPGGDVTFTLEIENTSDVPVQITSLSDTQSGAAINFGGCAALVGTTIGDGQTVTCTYIVPLTEPGIYNNTASVTVVDDSGGTATASAEASVEVTDMPSWLVVNKVVVWNGVPEDASQTFTICITGPAYPTGTEDGACQPVEFNGGELTWDNLIPGEYTVSEDDPGDDWDVTVSGSPVTVASYGTTTGPVVTNTRRLAGLTIVKYEDRDANGERGPGEPGLAGWGFTITGLNSTTTTTGANGEATVILPTGEYEVCEDPPASGWENSDPGGDPACKTVVLSGALTVSFGNFEYGSISGAKFVIDGLRCLSLTKTLDGPYRTSDDRLLSDGILPVAVAGAANGSQENLFYFRAEITVKNCGDTALTGVVLTDGFGGEAQPFATSGPGSVVISPAADPANGLALETLTWNIGTLAPGAAAALQVKVGTELNASGRLEPASFGQTIFYNGQSDSAGSAQVTTGEGLSAAVGAMAVSIGPNLGTCAGSLGAWGSLTAVGGGAHDQCAAVVTGLPVTAASTDSAPTSTPVCPLGDDGCTGIMIELTGVDGQGNAVSLQTQTDVNGLFSFTGLRPGIYTVAIINEPAGYFCAAPTPCEYTVTLESGETITGLVFHDQLQRGSLTVTKVVDWNGAAPDTGAAFTICLTGPSYPQPNCRTVDFDGGELVWGSLIPGDYTVTEIDPGAAWTVTITGSPAAVTAGGSAAAVVTNTFRTTDVQVTKTAVGSATRSVNYDWSISKTAAPASLTLEPGQSAPVNYTLVVTRSETGRTEQYRVSGDICVTNAGSYTALVTSIRDEVFGDTGSLGYIWLDLGGQTTIGAGAQVCYPYTLEFNPNGSSTFRNVATVTLSNGTQAAYASEAVSFVPVVEETLTDESASVTDTLTCPAGFTCAGSPGTWPPLTDGTTLAYTVTFTNESAACPASAVAPNTAVVTEVDTGQQHSSSASVTLGCQPPSAGSLVVTKVVDWAGAPPDPNQTFTICLTGPSYPQPDCQTADFDGGPLTWANLIPGSYTVTETDPGAAWVAPPPQVVVVSSNATAAVTVLNTYLPPVSTCPVLSPLPDTRVWSDGEVDVITLISGGPLTYQWDGWITNNGYYVFGSGSGTLQNGETLTIHYPPALDPAWGTKNREGAYEAHVRIHFNGACGYFGHNWDRWWHDWDNDGAAQQVDCNDYDASIYPGAPEIPGDGIDQDCDGVDLQASDQDGDGLPDAVDACPLDASHDEVGDPCNHDEDNDGVDDTQDACPLDASHDEVGDPCNHDEDGDGLPDAADVCPLDASHDEVGDPCNHDEDNDGVDDTQDTCPLEGDQGHGVGNDGCPLPAPVVEPAPEATEQPGL